MSRHKKQTVHAIDRCGQCQSHSQSSKKNVATVRSLRETDGDTLEVSTQAVAAEARGIPVMPPMAEHQRHRLVLL